MKKDVELFGVYSNDEYFGFSVAWGNKDGFGRIHFMQNHKTGTVEIDNECMDKEFIKNLLIELVDNATLLDN